MHAYTQTNINNQAYTSLQKRPSGYMCRVCLLQSAPLQRLSDADAWVHVWGGADSIMLRFIKVRWPSWAVGL